MLVKADLSTDCIFCLSPPQVQQQVQLLGGLLLKDPRMHMAKGRQHTRRRNSSLGPAGRQQQQAQAQLRVALPLAAVCVRAVRGWYCTLDEFRDDFTAAANSIRWAE